MRGVGLARARATTLNCAPLPAPKAGRPLTRQVPDPEARRAGGGSLNPKPLLAQPTLSSCACTKLPRPRGSSEPYGFLPCKQTRGQGRRVSRRRGAAGGRAPQRAAPPQRPLQGEAVRGASPATRRGCGDARRERGAHPVEQHRNDVAAYGVENPGVWQGGRALRAGAVAALQSRSTVTWVRAGLPRRGASPHGLTGSPPLTCGPSSARSCEGLRSAHSPHSPAACTRRARMQRPACGGTCALQLLGPKTVATLLTHR
jgi:hypothetical protein